MIPQPERGLSWGATQQRHAPIDHGSPGAAGPQRVGQRGQALLRRARADGQSPRLGGQYPAAQASGTAEPEAALAMGAEIAGQQRVTLGGDKGYDQKQLVRELRAHQVT